MKRVAWTIVFLLILNISLFILYGTMISSQEEPEMIRDDRVVDTQKEERDTPSFEG